MKNISEIRKSFWDSFEEFQPEYRARKRQNEYNTDIRVSFVDYVDHLQKSGIISEKLANRATL